MSSLQTYLGGAAMIREITGYIVDCDRCGTVPGIEWSRVSAEESAVAAGWWFPEPDSVGRSVDTDVLCPECADVVHPRRVWAPAAVVMAGYDQALAAVRDRLACLREIVVRMRDDGFDRDRTAALAARTIRDARPGLDILVIMLAIQAVDAVYPEPDLPPVRVREET